VAAKLAASPSASTTPVGEAASDTRKAPTAVFCAPAPSLRFSVAVFPDTETDCKVPFDGTLLNVHGAVQAPVQVTLDENVATTWSTRPSSSLSNICSEFSNGFGDGGSVTSSLASLGSLRFSPSLARTVQE